MSSKRDLKLAQQDVNNSVRTLLRDGVVHTLSGVVVIDLDAYEGLHRSFGELQILMNNLQDLDAPAAARDTSIAAAKQVLPARNTLLRQVLEAIVYRHHMTRGADGLTADQVELRIKSMDPNRQIGHASISSAVSTLEDREFIEDSGDRRLTRAKRKAIVWVPTEKAIAMINPARAKAADG